ncbi:MAG: DoxX family protein [Myxococcota bacterium]|nr:DoxX family protein [Myxococcota bacterium]
MEYLSPHFWVAFAVASFLAIVFLQSGLDKALDFSGNRAYLEELFQGSPLSGTVGPLLVCVTLFEIAAGAFSALGVAVLVFGGGASVAYFGAILSAIALLMVLFGQRLAKAYADAAVIAPYFLVSCLGIYILGY